MSDDKITIKDVAKRCLVSAPTVSRILNNRLDKFPVREDTIERVRRVAAEMGYIPNRFAQSLRSRKSSFIGLSVPYETTSPAQREANAATMSNPALSQIISGALDALQVKEYNIVILPRHEVSTEPGSLRPHHIFPDILEGLLYLMPSANHLEYLDIYKHRPNMVLMGHCTMDSDIPSCDIDNVREMRRLTGHLLASGARNIALLLPLPENFFVMRDRTEGYRQALAEQGVPFRPELVMYNIDFDQLNESIRDLLRRQPEIDGILVGDAYQYQTVHAISEMNKRTPEDILLASFGETDAARHEEPPVTTIEIPFYHMSYTAAEMLITRIEGGEAQDRIIPAQLNIRRSSQR